MSGISARASSIGLSKPDPVLSSFSPLGKYRSESPAQNAVPVSHIVPKTATPVQASSMSRLVASSSQDTPLATTQHSASYGDGEVLRSDSALRNPFRKDNVTQHQSPGQSVQNNGNGRIAEPLGRLSISGKLSSPSATKTTTTPARDHSQDEGQYLSGRFSSLPVAGMATAEKASSNSVTTASGISTATSSVSTNGGGSSYKSDYSSASSTSSNIIGNSNSYSTSNPLPDMIKILVEKSIAEAMSSVRNDIQNLHVDLIKQSLAQQSMLKQIVSTLPDAYRKLAEENQSLREDLERLRTKLYQ